MFKENFAPPIERRKPERRESQQEKQKRMDALLATISSQINENLNALNSENNEENSHFVLKDGSINMQAFSTDTENDEAFVRERYIDWSGLENERVQNHYRNEYGCQNFDEMLKKYISKRESENGILLEKALTILLHRYLGENYLVLRSSSYDDFANGVDNLIINKNTGEAICSFDGLNEEFNQNRRQKKLQKVIKKTKAGGAKIKYGLNIKDGKLEQSAMTNLPVFYLALNKSELNSLISSLSNDLNAPINNKEEEIIAKILETFSEQIQMLYQERIPDIMMDKLTNFEKTLDKLR